MGIRVLTSSMSHRRTACARAWLEAREPAEEILIIGATLDAANELAREVALTKGAAFGRHRLSLTQLAARRWLRRRSRHAASFPSAGWAHKPWRLVWYMRSLPTAHLADTPAATLRGADSGDFAAVEMTTFQVVARCVMKSLDLAFTFFRPVDRASRSIVGFLWVCCQTALNYWAHGFNEQIFGADEQVRGPGPSD